MKGIGSFRRRIVSVTSMTISRGNEIPIALLDCGHSIVKDARLCKPSCRQCASRVVLERLYPTPPPARLEGNRAFRRRRLQPGFQDPAGEVAA